MGRVVESEIVERLMDDFEPKSNLSSVGVSFPFPLKAYYIYITLLKYDPGWHSLAIK